MSQKVVIGMSGGVDSSVAAFLLQEQGFEVEAVFMKNWEEANDFDTTRNNKSHICPAAQDFADAMSVCDKLHIPLQAVNFSQEYWQRVFQYMLDEYAQGRTPNPDIMCNKEIKFKEFLNYAKKLNADYIATGHYARNVPTNNCDITTIYQLYKAVDKNKDQTYFLYTLEQQQLAYTLFPLGEITKNEVRNIAKKTNLSNYAKKDSTGICFIGERNFKKFLSEYLLAKPGEIVNTTGEVLGKHDGLMFYTLGQRQGLGIGGKKGATELPWYVVKKDLTNNKLIVAQDANHPLLMNDSLSCNNIHWIAETPSTTSPLHCLAKIRYRQDDQPCVITITENKTYNVVFKEKQRAITPGQSVVFYTDEGECLGGGIIN